MIYGDIFLITFELISTVLLYLLAGYASRVFSTKWRLCYVIPAIVCLVAAACTGTDISLFGVYIASLLLLLGFIRETCSFRKLVCMLSGLLILLSVPVCVLNPGYRTPNYLAEFRESFSTMREHYCLTEHKGIDWDALYEEYEPQFRTVNKKHDKVANYILWQQFCQEFYDGHVAYITDMDTTEDACRKMYGNDYGLSLITLENGDTVAVNVEAGSVPAAAGIHNGTVITAWDGRPIEEIKDSIETPIFYLPYQPVAENAAFYDALLVAGIGSDSVAITYIDDSGNERFVDAPQCGFYCDRLSDTLDVICRRVVGSNLAWKELTKDTAVLLLTDMLYDSQSGATGDYSKMKEELREELLRQKEAGVRNLIIDARNNSGGDPNFLLVIARLLAPEGEYPYAFSGVWDDVNNEFMVDSETGKYVVGTGTRYTGENLWGDGRIIILVNSNTISGGDHFVDLMSVHDNVTIMGFHPSNGSGQAVRGIHLEDGILQFSSVPTLNEDGTIYIDTDTSRISTTPLDVKIPFNEEAVRALFDEERDYALDCALEYLGE